MLLHVPNVATVTLNRISVALTLECLTSVRLVTTTNVTWVSSPGCGLDPTYVTWITNRVSAFTRGRVT